jgi:subtilisin family serine protease
MNSRIAPAGAGGSFGPAKIVRRVGTMVLAAIAVSPLLVAAQDVAVSRFRHLEAARAFKPAITLAGERAEQMVTVVVHMSADSVAAVRAQSPDHSITAAQRESIRQAVAQQHASIDSALAARGARVLNHFHSALNGVKVRIARDQLAGLAALPGVVDVLAVRTYHRNNVQAVPFIGAPAAWQATGFRGEHIKIASIDTGIDYTHANFGGPGTPEAYQQAFLTDTLPPDPKLFGPNAPKVKGGIDLVGDNYDANADGSKPPLSNVPQPDPNPLDCYVPSDSTTGHGSHTAGTAAGFGVASDGTTYQGPWDPSAYLDPTKFTIGPGVAPKADLYAVRVFGCTGETNAVVDGIDWAVEHDMDVITMSLGADFGTAEDADSVAADSAAHAGVIVVASVGNEGPAPYLAGDPSTSNATISVAGIESHPHYPGAQLTLSSGPVLEAQDSNGLPLPNGITGVVALKNPDGSLSLGCDESEYTNPLVPITGKLVVTLRGDCARVQRAQFGAAHGAAAVAMINAPAGTPGYPPYEGPIPGVDIPFLGVLDSDGNALVAAANANDTTGYQANTLDTPGYRQAASFSSGGPRFGDSFLKPNIAAPGVSILSTAIATGNQGKYDSGTSMSAPFVAGVAALVSQAHPGWNQRELSAAVVETADPQQLTDYAPSIEGAGLVQALGATRTQAVVLSHEADSGHALSFGFEEFLSNFHTERQITVRNLGSSAIVFNVTSTRTGGVAHTLHLSGDSIRIGPHSDAKLDVSLTVPVATVGATHDLAGDVLFPEVAGYLTLTPANPAMNGGVTLHVPYYLVPRARSNVLAQLVGSINSHHPSANLLLANLLGGIPGEPDYYAWGLSSRKPQGVTLYDTRAVGTQTIPISATNAIVVFAVNTFERFSSPGRARFDVLIDVDGDGKPDFDVIGIDYGLITTGTPNGQFGAAVIKLSTGSGIVRSVDTPTDGSTVLLPLLASDLGLTPSQPRFTYTFKATNIADRTTEILPGTASFNAFTPAITNAVSTGLLTLINPNKTAVVPVSINPSEFAQTPPLGLMVIVQDNVSGSQQAELISLGH